MTLNKCKCETCNFSGKELCLNPLTSIYLTERKVEYRNKKDVYIEHCPYYEPYSKDTCWGLVALFSIILLLLIVFVVGG